jgi:hypothetical protein
MLSLTSMELGLFWGYGPFANVEGAFGNDHTNFANVVCQSLRELFYLTYPTVALKEHFLAEEDLKLSHGYYPDSIRQTVAQLVDQLKTARQRIIQTMSKVPGGERHYLLLCISPLSTAASLSVPRRDLTDTEQRALDRFVTVGLERQFSDPGWNELLTFFLNMRNEQDANASNVGVQHPMHFLFEIAHSYLTQYCNILGPRISPQYEQLSYRSPGFRDLLMQMIAKEDTELASALFPQCKTIETIARELLAKTTTDAAHKTST